MLLLLAMTIAELLTQAAEPLSKAPSDMNSAEQSHLVRAVNAGLAGFVETLPDIRRAETANERLAAALTKSATVIQGETAVTFDPAWSANDQSPYLGRTVAADGRWNQLRSTSTLLHPWESAGGTFNLEIRSDAVQIGPLHDGIDGDVVLVEAGGQTILKYGKPLVFTDEEPGRRLEQARPQYWWIEPFNGMSAGASPLFLLRVYPQPDAVYNLTFKRRLWPTEITVDMIDSTTALPVLAREAAHLVNWCMEGLINHPLWLGNLDKAEVRAAAQTAREFLEARKPNQGHSKPGLVRTSKGF